MRAISGTLTDTRPITRKDEGDSPVTVTAGQTGTVFTNEGASATVIFNLPASAGCVAGKTTFTFFAIENQVITVTPDGTDHLYFTGDGPSFYDSDNTHPANSHTEKSDTMTILYQGGGIWMSLTNSPRWAT
jgi:hypothetical protein